MSSLWFLGCVLVLCFDHGSSGRSLDSWKHIDYDKLEKEWEDGDAVDELRSEGDILYEQIERRNGPSTDSLIPGASNPNGPQMMFVTLAGSWTKSEIHELAAQWKELLRTGGVEVNCYEIETNKVMVAFQRGWLATDVKAFILSQPQVQEMEWNSQRYTPSKVDL